MTAAEQRAEAILRRLPENPVVCEIGVFTGSLSRVLLKRPDITLYMIDAWSSDYPQSYKDTNDFHSNMSQEEQDRYYQTTRVVAEPHGDRAKIIRKYSKDAVKDFPDQFFDLVFIDADHSYEGCLRDIQDYYPKVKKGGYISGHDYENNEQDFKFGVTEAVDEMFDEVELDLNYTWFKCIPSS